MNLEDDPLAALGLAYPGGRVDQQLAVLRVCFQRMRQLDDDISRKSPLTLTEAAWGYLGLLGKLYKLTLAFVDQASQANLVAMQVLARSIAETFCSAAWVCDRPSRLVSLVQQQGIKVGKLLNAGYLRLPELREQYENLSEFAHPHRSGHLLGFRQVDERLTKGPFSPFSMEVARPTIEDSIQTTASIVVETIELLLLIATEHAHELERGRTMVQMTVSAPETA